MFLGIDRNDPRPIYRQVADELKALIASGKLQEGDALPPVRKLAADLGVTLSTIATAYRELAEEGLIIVRHGSGASVAARGPSRHPSRSKLRKPLRSALADMVLTGMGRNEILSVVSAELKALMKGAQ